MLLSSKEVWFLGRWKLPVGGSEMLVLIYNTRARPSALPQTSWLTNQWELCLSKNTRFWPITFKWIEQFICGLRCFLLSELSVFQTEPRKYKGGFPRSPRLYVVGDPKLFSWILWLEFACKPCIHWAEAAGRDGMSWQWGLTELKNSLSLMLASKDKKISLTFFSIYSLCKLYTLRHAVFVKGSYNL